MRYFLHKNGYAIYRCTSCGLGQTDLGEEYESFVSRFYDMGYFTGDESCSAYSDYKSDRMYIRANMEKFFEKIRRIKPGGALLDIGCAMGYFVELALSYGFDAYGLEPSSYAYSEAKKQLGHRVRYGTLEKLIYAPNSFDVITLIDVFEHLKNPKEDLRKLHRYLKKDGIILIATGDSDSMLARFLRRRWTFYIPPQHLFFFSRRTLMTLLEQECFVPVLWFRVGKLLSLQYVFHLARTTGESRIAKKLYPVIERLKLGKLPVYLPVGDNMVVIARKSS